VAAGPAALASHCGQPLEVFGVACLVHRRDEVSVLTGVNSGLIVVVLRERSEHVFTIGKVDL
jgi:hypothetical protein